MKIWKKLKRKMKRALKKNENGAGKVVLDKPQGLKITGITNSGVEVSWKTVDNALGYEIYRSYTNDGQYKKIASNNKKKETSYIDHEFDHQKKELYYRVKSFSEKNNSKRVCSEATEPVVAAYQEEMKAERAETYMYDGTERMLHVLHGWGEVDDAVWTTSDAEVVKVQDGGMLQALKTGEAMVECYSKSLDQRVISRVVVNRTSLEPMKTKTRRFVYNEERKCWENKVAEQDGNAVIMMAGDMMCGATQSKKQYTKLHGYSFNDSFEFVRGTTAKSDFAIGSLKTLMAAGLPYAVEEPRVANKSNHNNPSRYLDAVLHGGFDAVTMSNAYNCESGTRALIDTIEEVELRKVPHTGVFYNAETPRWMLVDIKGIKVGFVAYMSEQIDVEGKESTWTLEEREAMLNVFAKEKAKKDIEMCRENGAEYIIAYMQWGKKNKQNITKEQKVEAAELAEAGVDYIVGTNPCVIQEYDEIVTESGKHVPCFYSIGNFHSSMKGLKENRDSVVVRIRLKRNEEAQVVLEENNYIPYHTYKNQDGCYLVPMTTRKEFAQGVLPTSRKKCNARIDAAVGKKISVFGNETDAENTTENLKVDAKEKEAEKERSARRKKKKEQHIAAVMAKTGWDYEYAKAKMDEAKKKVGCGYYVYAYFEFYNMTEEEQREQYENWKAKKQSKVRSKQRKRENCLAEAMAATGWTREYAEAQLDETMERTGCNAEEYREYRSWNLDHATQESFFLMSHTDAIRTRFNVDLNLSRLIADKSEANVHFAKYIDRKWCMNRELSFDKFQETFKECTKLFYKPTSSCGGRGAQPFDIDESNMQEVYDEIMGLPEGVVEEFVVQHPRLTEMSPRILNTVRLTSISSNEPIDKEGNHFAIPYAMLKMGGATGYVDNLREGGVGAAIDLETGKLCTDAVDVNLKTYTHHPVSGVEIKGFEVPFFAEAKQMVQRIVEENNMKGYLGWDVAITNRGPMLIEINGRPSSTLLELPFYNTPQRGNKHKMEKYM